METTAPPYCLLFGRIGKGQQLKKAIVSLTIPAALFLAPCGYAQLPSTLGWSRLANTAQESACPDQTGVAGSFGCLNGAVYYAWSGGIGDTKRNRLVIQGGGHGDYYGNELYALDLNSNPVRLVRLTEPTRTSDPPGGAIACVSDAVDSPFQSVPEGCSGAQCKIASRHTRDTFIYVDSLDKIYELGGSHPTNGCSPNILGDLWEISASAVNVAGRTDAVACTSANGCLTSNDTPWIHTKTQAQVNAELGYGIEGFDKMVGYDPGRNKMYISRIEGCQFFEYDIATNKFTSLATGCGSGNYNGAGEVNPNTHQFVVVGNGNYRSIDISAGSSYAHIDHTAESSCAPLVNASDPGLTFDSAAGKLVGYPGSGNTIYVINQSAAGPNDWTCTAESYGTGAAPGTTHPADPAPGNGGIYGRFQYFPLINAYAACTNPGSDCFLLRRQPAGPPSPSGPDFAARCAAAGVLRCVGFDAPSDIAGVDGDNTGIESGDSTPVLDSSVKASGNSSLKFTIPSNSGANSSGAYFANFSSDLSVQFGENQEFYIQWRQRFSPESLNTYYQGGAGWKQDIIGAGDKSGCTSSTLAMGIASGICTTSCTTLETVTQNSYQRGFPQMYNSCTGSTSHGPYQDFAEPFGSSDFKLENAMPAPYCLYSQGQTSPVTYFPPAGNCFKYFPNEWMTFQVHIKTGPRGAAGVPGGGANDEFVNSHVDLWVAREGQPSQQVLNWGPYNLSAGDPSKNLKYGKVWLLPYDTGKDPSQVTPTAYTWYDELIISRNKIADPGGSAPPPDTVPPTVTITSPANGATVSGTISVTGTAADNVAVANVQVSVDGGAFSAASGIANWTFSLNTTSLTNASHTISAKATDTSGNVSTIASVSVTVNNASPPPSAPAITSALTAAGTAGSAFSYQITASNSPTGFNATSLPSGLSINTATGLISGIPTAAGTSSVTLSATNAGGTGTATLTLTVNNPAPNAPIITSAGAAAGTVGAAFSYQITATNSPTSFNATGLPAGLSVNASNGLISGTPATAGTSNVTISAANAGGTGATNAVFTINPRAPVINSPTTAAGTAGLAFSYQIIATNNPTSFNATGLPGGLSVNASNGLISGTPSAAGTSSITLSATNAGGTGTATLTLTVNAPAPPAVSIAPLSTTTVFGTVTLTASASSNLGIASVQFQLDGINLGSLITAPPFTLSWNTAQAAPGTHSLIAVATDSAGNKTTSAPITVTVIRGADAAPGLRQALVYPNPAVKSAPTIRAFLGIVSSVEITIFDAAGRVVNSGSVSGAPTGISNGQYYYDYRWTGSKSSGMYFAVIHGKAADGTILRARVRFAVIR